MIGHNLKHAVISPIDKSMGYADRSQVHHVSSNNLTYQERLMASQWKMKDLRTKGVNWLIIREKINI